MSSAKVGITFGAFDLLHPGHVLFLRDATKFCNCLIVGLHADPSIERKEKNTPIQSLYERYTQLSACTYVDRIIPYTTEKDVENMLATLHIDIRFLGDDYIGKKVTGEEICAKRDIVIQYLERSHNYSSTELRNRILK